MGILLDRLAAQKLLVSDGAWGTMLYAKGLRPGDCPEEWNLSHPAAVQGVAAAYAKAGADIVLTNTFGGTRAKLAKSAPALADKTREINLAGAKLSLAGAAGAVVAASIGPSGEFLEPLGELSEEQMEELFAEQIGALIAGGVRALCIETMSALEEARCAIRAAKKLDAGVDVICTMTFSATAAGPRTMMGVSPAQAAEELTAAGADVVGANCGNGPDEMIGIAAEFKKHTQRPILVHANAGLPQMVEGRTVYLQTPPVMASKVKALVEAGARIVGGCCGTTPEHIAAIKAVLDELRK